MTVVDAARAALGPVGVCLPASFTSTASADQQRDAVTRLEHAGYHAIWANEVIGKDALVQLALLLAATKRAVFGTSIANIWARPAQTMHAAAASWPRPTRAGWCSGSESDIRRRRTVSGGNSVLRWPPCAAIWN
jgi:Luciferase-like monooxygenase